MNNKVSLEVSAWTIIKIILVVGAFFVAYLLRDVLVILLIVGILAAAFRPIVAAWARKIGNSFAVILLLLIVILVIAGFIYIVVPPLAEQTRQLIAAFPGFIVQYTALKSHFPTLTNAIVNYSQNLGSYTGSVISFTTSLLGGIASFFMIIILTVYILLDQKFFYKFQSLIPEDRRETVIDLIKKITIKTGDWLRGQILLGLIMGLLSFIGLSIIGVPYALTLAVIAGVTELLPIVGAIIAGIISILVALTVSPLTAILTAGLALVLHQSENVFIAPKVMQKAIGLPPAVIIVSILIGGKLLGLAGALLAVPISAIVYVIIQEWPKIRRTNNA